MEGETTSPWLQALELLLRLQQNILSMIELEHRRERSRLGLEPAPPPRPDPSEEVKRTL